MDQESSKRLLDEFILVTDNHIHPYSEFRSPEERLEICFNVIRRVFKEATARGIKKVLFVGDLFNVQRYIHTDVVNGTISVFKEHEDDGIEWIAISGNHDHTRKNTILRPSTTALSYLTKGLSNFKLIDDACMILGTGVSVTGIPYYEFRQDFKQRLKEWHDKPRSADFNILMIHQVPEDIGNTMIPFDFSTSDIDPTRFQVTLNGHIHKREILGNNIYVLGSPNDRDLSDLGTSKGIYHLKCYSDLTHSMEFICLDSEFPKVFTYMGTKIPPRLQDQFVCLLPELPKNLLTVSGITETEKYGTQLSPIEIVTNYLEGIGKSDLLPKALECLK